MLEEVMTDKFTVGFSLTFTASDPTSITSASFDAVINRFYEELLDAEERCAELTDPDVSARLADLTADVVMVIEADSILDAQVQAITIGRTALHAIEVGTPGWEAVIADVASPRRLAEDLLDA